MSLVTTVSLRRYFLLLVTSCIFYYSFSTRCWFLSDLLEFRVYIFMVRNFYFISRAILLNALVLNFVIYNLQIVCTLEYLPDCLVFAPLNLL